MRQGQPISLQSCIQWFKKSNPEFCNDNFLINLTPVKIDLKMNIKESFPSFIILLYAVN